MFKGLKDLESLFATFNTDYLRNSGKLLPPPHTSYLKVNSYNLFSISVSATGSTKHLGQGYNIPFARWLVFVFEQKIERLK